ncbi:Seed linoleate 13S-lipoxygenase-1 [Fulvia fulva]|uniref:Manganese lipoxygenase n=1 Tax=Passalora fulva TaxID=5499 RepID=A0A9Q8PHS4_PASFU|nr:Seed linoleate 13S-lipoxygenase-1 [Fulvia fulva]KAK4626805.1 Seed linoleate 13S-lipoxygenase-1 [Fulvia fulva]KAK4627784.1 Seed linoleate 13S-lipoxygenase-1 [Fulvia fulva]UJO22725.1 Seed linoleate 13S-lipoxygenase-1 [Fulvia fulva]WPV13313.1 Seed linoleate 13S-lipoxygenase-1 [Fulvia fulva]WPV28201.1 Seed linoleate 13S-lipoxygenase-1 [Fulvia fulva]
MANLAVPRGLLLNADEVVGGGAKHKEGSNGSQWPMDPEHFSLPLWDTAVLLGELGNNTALPTATDILDEDYDTLMSNPEVLVERAQKHAPPQLEEGTYRGTQLALTKIYQLIEKSYESFMDAANFEPSMPRPLSLQAKRRLFGFTDPVTDGYPPHLNLASNRAYVKEHPEVDEGTAPLQRPTLKPTDLHSAMRLAQLSVLLPHAVPKTFVEQTAAKAKQEKVELAFGPMGRPDQGEKLADVENYNKAMRKRTAGNDIFDLPNIGDLEDWYSDHRFAQQFFTGPNPTTIERASDAWIQLFVENATQALEDQKMKQKIQEIVRSDRDSLYMQDYSYFRAFAGMRASDEISCEFDETFIDGNEKTTRTSKRCGVAAVCLFHLPKDAKLQPLAIIPDWRGNAADSVFIYNKELAVSEQKTDWPWRYAKTCVQSSDWLRHEVVVHLTNTHLIEEAVIVGAQRSFEDAHPVFQLLYPHWQKTLTINAGARTSLVPNIIIDLIGLTKDQALKFIMAEYSRFDFTGRYVPADLKSRGFDPEERHEPRYKNYAYARCIHSMWFKIRSWVEEMLSLHYTSDESVAADSCIQFWCREMRAPGGEGDTGGAGLTSFPTITTLDGLIDAVTMCIHLASPQHTAVNYLQSYHQSFVINKPPCLYRPVPATRAELNGFEERDLVEALPMNHPREWLLASHIPYLLSAKPGDKESLIIYAASKYHLYKAKPGEKEQKIKAAAAKFYKSLAESEQEFRGYAAETWDADVHLYDVLSPSWNAVSIVI